MTETVSHGAPEHDAFLHLEVAQRVPLPRVIDAETYFLRLVRAVSRSVVAGHQERIEWEFVTAEANGVVSLSVTPLLAPDLAASAEEIVDAIASGMAALEHEAVRPSHFSDDALEFARDLALLSTDLKRVGVRNGKVGAVVTNNAADNASTLLAPAFEEYGSVEGTVEAVNFHAKVRHFDIYDSLDRHRIRCNFGQTIDLDLIRDALLRRVLVTGQVSYRTAGAATQVRVENISVFPDEDRLPTADQVRGILR